jgi:hypothetical protein
VRDEVEPQVGSPESLCEAGYLLGARERGLGVVPPPVVSEGVEGVLVAARRRVVLSSSGAHVSLGSTDISLPRTSGSSSTCPSASSIANGFRILGKYHRAGGVALYVITEADRSATTILLPSE